MIVSEIRKLALFEFIDTSPITNFVKGLLGADENDEDFGDFCDIEKDPNCDKDDQTSGKEGETLFGRLL